jgi:phospholipase C
MVSSRLPDDPIRHVVHLILENRSFDQMLGCMKAVYSDLDGIDPTALKSNEDTAGQVYTQAATQVRQMLKWDPHHEVPRVAVQLENGNSGFVKDFSQQYPDSTSVARQQIMDYYGLDFLPALHALGRNFKICDRWFSSLPGPTWPNRFFALTGTSNGRVNMPSDGTHKADLSGYFQQTQTTLFDRLNDQAVHWKVYFHDIPQTTVLDGQRQPHNVARYFYVSQLYEDARGPESEFPEYCLIEPDFMGYGQNDGHPPHDIMRSERLIADVYNALRANDELWRSTLLIVMFDEHGGFYDHVIPPKANPPDDAKPSEYAFDQLGVRVPALLVSPWVKPGVDHTQFDHTSVLKYLTEKWGLGPLGRRTAAATSIGRLIESTPIETRPDRISLSIDQLRPPNAQAEEEALGIPSSHQAALAQLAQWIEMEAVEGAPKVAVVMARAAEAAKAFAEKYIFRLDGAFPVSIAQPDKLSLPLQTKATDSIAAFMMRLKQYAAMGLKTRFDQGGLTPDQQQHSLQTLALITGRNFHLENSDEKLDNAKAWLSKGSSGAMK